MLKIKVKRKFEVGDEVQSIGHRYETAKIIEVLKDNKYKVEYTTYNESARVKRSSGTAELNWYSLVKADQNQSDEIFNKRKENWRTGISFHNTRLMELVRRVLGGHVDMNPEYQRGLVWDQNDKELLIESIFEGIEIGKFSFVTLDFREGSDLLYEILDGKQRATTLVEFVTDQFKYKDKYYSELNVQDRLYFESYNVTMGETRFELAEKEKREYFLRLNTRGKAQSENHLNKVRKQLEDFDNE